MLLKRAALDNPGASPRLAPVHEGCPCYHADRVVTACRNVAARKPHWLVQVDAASSMEEGASGHARTAVIIAPTPRRLRTRHRLWGPSSSGYRWRNRWPA